jgi:hypothetical protein
VNKLSVRLSEEEEKAINKRVRSTKGRGERKKASKKGMRRKGEEEEDQTWCYGDMLHDSFCKHCDVCRFYWMSMIMQNCFRDFAIMEKAKSADGKVPTAAARVPW